MVGVPLAPKARAGRQWRHGYYTVLSWSGRVGAGKPSVMMRRRGRTVAWGWTDGRGREVSTLRSGHPCRRRRRRRRVLASLITAAAPPGQAYTFGSSHTSDALATSCDDVLRMYYFNTRACLWWQENVNRTLCPSYLHRLRLYLGESTTTTITRLLRHHRHQSRPPCIRLARGNPSSPAPLWYSHTRLIKRMVKG